MKNEYITGAMIKRLREKKKLTQSELAEKIFVTDKAVSKWETGRKKQKNLLQKKRQSLLTKLQKSGKRLTVLKSALLLVLAVVLRLLQLPENSA